MKQTKKDFFTNKANEYDKEVLRVSNVMRIASLILKELTYQKDFHLMDFGSGTGLLLSKIAPFVNKITAVDISNSMNDVLKRKIETINCHVEILDIDLSKHVLKQNFDGIISSMTLHHIKDTQSIFEKFYDMLSINGSLAIADLDTEDGTFHKQDTGVYHLGFDREEFTAIAKSVGFKKVKIQSVGLVEKPYGKYPVFLLTAHK